MTTHAFPTPLVAADASEPPARRWLRPAIGSLLVLLFASPVSPVLAVVCGSLVARGSQSGALVLVGAFAGPMAVAAIAARLAGYHRGVLLLPLLAAASAAGWALVALANGNFGD